MTYDDNFYDTIRSGSMSSAAKVVPRVLDLVGAVETVADVGCGQGWWAKAFEDQGCTVHGFDGAYVTNPLVPFTAVDLATEKLPNLAFDLVVCLEVAEHLPEEWADDFVKQLSDLADRAILFSAAIPGQTGAGHINCQWPDYWIERFEPYGWYVSGQLRTEFWNDTEVEPWYRQNMILFTEVPLPLSSEPVLSVVHPEIWAWKL